MSVKNMVLVTVLLLGPGMIWQGYTNAVLSDGAVMGVNTFATAETFATPTPTPSPTSTPTPTPSPSPTPIPGIANHVVISEVQISQSGAGNDDHDFVEFYNPTNSPFDLNGHRLVKRTGNSSTDTLIKSWTSSAIVPAHGYYLWASSDDGYSTTIGADTTTGENIAAANSISLRFGAENTGTIIDALSWSSQPNALKEGSHFSSAIADDQSMERMAYSTSTTTTMNGGVDALKGNGYDTDNNSIDFVLRTTSQPQNSSSPTETP